MIGDNIKKIRKAHGMSQDELAEQLNVSRQSISLWENGQTLPSIDNVIALAKLWGVSTNDLLMDDAPETAQTEGTEPEPAPSGPPAQPEPPAPSKKKKTVLICAAAALAVAAIAAGIIIYVNSRPTEEPAVSDTSEVSTAGSVTEEMTEKSTETEKATDKATEMQRVVTEKPETKIEETVAPVAPVTDAPVTPVTSAPPVTTKKEEVTDPPKQEPATTKAEEPSEPRDLFGYFKEFVVEKGRLNGDYCVYSKDASTYGGYSGENFGLWYWGDTDRVEFSLHSVLDETYSICFYIRLPKKDGDPFEYISSYYYRDSGNTVYEARGPLDPATFTENYPLTCTSYYGSTDVQNSFMEMSRTGICDALRCLKQFLEIEKCKYSFADLGFVKFN